MTSEAEATLAVRPRRRELTVLLLTGAAGAAVVLLAARQQFARVEVVPVHPLPVTVTSVSGQDLIPVASALALAALASMAAVLATRGLLRRLTGLISALLGAGIGFAAVGKISRAAVIAAAGSANLSAASGAGSSSAPGSTTAGNSTGSATGSLAGFPSHVIFAGSGWRALILVGAVIIAGVGLAVIVRAPKLPAMSSRYERTGRRSAPAGPARSAAEGGQATQQRALLRSTSAANMWESLTAGADPTVGPPSDSTQRN